MKEAQRKYTQWLVDDENTELKLKKPLLLDPQVHLLALHVPTVGVCGALLLRVCVCVWVCSFAHV